MMRNNEIMKFTMVLYCLDVLRLAFCFTLGKLFTLFINTPKILFEVDTVDKTISIAETLISEVEGSSKGFGSNCIKIFLFASTKSFMLFSRSDAIQSSSLGEPLTTAIEACSESTSTQERSTGLLHDKVPRKQNN